MKKIKNTDVTIILGFVVIIGITVLTDSTSVYAENDVPTNTPVKIKDHDLRKQTIKPSAGLMAQIKKYREIDPDASFTFFNGHIDNFSTAPKNSVPDYALPVLKKLGLSTKAGTPMRLSKPTHSKELTKPSHDIGNNRDTKLPYVTEERIRSVNSEGKDDAAEQRDIDVQAEKRTKDAQSPHKMVEWKRPSQEVLKIERRAASAVLASFLKQRAEIFEINEDEFKGTMKLTDYKHGAYTRQASYKQYYSKNEPVLYGKTIVQFDINWNVVGISRMIITPKKFTLPKLPQQISDDEAVKIASGAMKGCESRDIRKLSVEPSVDLIRKQKVWSVELTSNRGDCHWRVILDRADGKILNVSNLVDHYNDATVNRWYFSGGDLFTPQQTVSTNQYTRNDRRLEHDFFYVMNDHRCEGDAETNCSETSHSDTWCEEAHGSYNGSSYIRATRRSNRDFDSYYPGGSSETFGETNAYYWSRWFSQWLKPSLDAMGVLPSSASDYPRVLIITNACRSGSAHSSSYQVTTDDNKGEGTNVIRLAHRDPSGSSNHNAACQGGGCFDNPSNIHHELNHFYLKRYYSVGSDLDCGSSVQLKFTHEGALGTAVPHAYWHDYYNVGYDPSSTDKLYFSNSDIGRVHTDSSDLVRLSDYLCVDNTDDPYRAGRVIGQALWKFYHGTKVDGSTISGTWYPSTDTDFNVLVYWAAELQSGSTYQDRYEYANRLMEILDKYSNWSSSGKSDYCDIFDTHDLRTYINSDYCN